MARRASDYANFHKADKIGKQLGLSKDNYTKTRTSGGGAGSRVRDNEGYMDAVTNAMNNNPHIASAMRDEALSGNKKAKKYAKKGFKDFTAATEGHKYLEKLHKKNGYGGSFSSASDYAGLSYNAAQKYKDSLIENLKQPEVTSFDDPEPETPQFNVDDETAAQESAERDARIKEYEDNQDTQGDRLFPGIDGDSSDPQSFKDAYSFNIKKGLANAIVATRGPQMPSFLL